MRRIRVLLTIWLMIGLAAPARAQAARSPQDHCDAAQPAALTTMQFTAPEDALQPNVDYRAIFCASAGAIYVDLYESLTPVTVNNFVFLAQQGYYDNTTFHRVIPNFMAQAGDPTATGRGGPGYQFQDEPIGFLTFDRPGLLAMANAGPGSNGSQFFITTAAAPHLNYKHTIFGDVLLGQGNVEAIRERDPASASQPGETLFTVLIITDPAFVASDSIAIEPATAAEAMAAFESFTDGLTPALQLVEERSGYLTTEALAATVADDQQAGFADFADRYGHQYRNRMQISNGACDASVFFSELGYWLDVFADAGSARAAAADDFMRLWLESYDYAPDPDAAVYRREAETCTGEAGLRLLSLYPRGRSLVTIDLLIAESILEQASAAEIVNYMNLQLEGALAGAFKGAMRA